MPPRQPPVQFRLSGEELALFAQRASEARMSVNEYAKALALEAIEEPSAQPAPSGGTPDGITREKIAPAEPEVAAVLTAAELAAEYKRQRGLRAPPAPRQRSS